MPKYYFYIKNDKSKEPSHWVNASSRLKAAKLFAKGKDMELKQFLSIFSISK